MARGGSSLTKQLEIDPIRRHALAGRGQQRFGARAGSGRSVQSFPYRVKSHAWDVAPGSAPLYGLGTVRRNGGRNANATTFVASPKEHVCRSICGLSWTLFVNSLMNKGVFSQLAALNR